MALGEWLSVTNSHELTLSQLDLHIDTPSVQKPALPTGRAGSAALISFVLFALGALVPLVPLLLFSARLRIVGCIAVSLAALFTLGVATSLFNARSALFSGLRQVVIGVAAAAITYTAGNAFTAFAGGF